MMFGRASQRNWGDEVRFGSFSTELARFASQPTSASPQKLTLGPNEKFVAMGRLQVGKENLHVAGVVGAAMCSASHDGISVKS
jgi:hypothetical protein